MRKEVLQYLVVSDQNATADSTHFLAISVDAKGNFTVISCIAKIIPSADWFVGLSSIDTCKNASFITDQSGNLFGWDGGIDNAEAYDESLPQPTSEAVQVLPALLAAPEGYGQATVTQTQIPTSSPTPPAQDDVNFSNPSGEQLPQPFVPSEVPDQMLEEAEPERRVCVDAAALNHLPPNSLLYAQHRMARVLCDPYGTCATSGHMVYYRDVPMMMKSYCRLTPCTEHLMYVNSPRYSRALRISTKNPYLQFTALAARYSTTVEEHIMSFALRMGL
ncbi:Spondin [Gracilaria domingensis]|nr:Spondin [Gracilaria domingensis]